MRHDLKLCGVKGWGSFANSGQVCHSCCKRCLLCLIGCGFDEMYYRWMMSGDSKLTLDVEEVDWIAAVVGWVDAKGRWCDGCWCCVTVVADCFAV